MNEETSKQVDSRLASQKKRWLRLGLAFIFFIGVSIGLGYLVNSIFAHYRIPNDIPWWVAMLIVTGILAAINLSFLPLPFGVSIMLVAAMHWNPILVALFGSIGACIGEFSGYLFGYIGKRIAIDEKTIGYKMVQGWIRKFGIWAIALLSFQPIIPFEIGGFIAGAARMPVKYFFPALLLGKFPKYIIIVYLGNVILHHLPGL